MNTPSQPAWRPTTEEVARLGSAFFGMLPATFGVPYLAPLASLVFEYAYRRRDRLFTVLGGDVVTTGRAWNPWARPVPARRGRRRPPEYDLLDLFGRRLLREQRLTLTPRLTRAARAAGLRPGDPVPIALVNGSWDLSESGLIVPAQAEAPVTVTLPRGEYRVLALGSLRETLFREHDPYVATGSARVAAERRGDVDVSLGPRGTPRERSSGAAATPPGRGRSRGRCLYCGRQPPEDGFLEHLLNCPQRPAVGGRAGAPVPAAVCLVCHRTFADRARLVAHLRTRHPDLSEEMFGRNRRDESVGRGAITPPSRRRVPPRQVARTATPVREPAARGAAASVEPKRSAPPPGKVAAGAKPGGAGPVRVKRSARTSGRRNVDDGPAAARRDFVAAIAERGFWLGPGAKHVYYHDIDAGAPRIVLRGARIRLELGNAQTGEYELWRSYRLMDEAQLALAAVGELKRERLRRSSRRDAR